MTYRDTYLGTLSRAAEFAHGADAGALSQTAMELLALHELPRVRALIHAADWTHPDVLRQAPALSQYLWLAGDVQGALDFMMGAVQHLEPNAALMFSLGMAQRYAGKFEAATQSFETAIALDPLFSPAHWALATHAKAATPGERLPRLRYAFQNARSAEDASEMLYALHRELHDAGIDDRAFSALENGMKVKHRLTGGQDHAAFTAAIARIRGWMQIEDASANAGFMPIFVVGMPRSGTTLLERMLSQLPPVRSAGELRDFEVSISHQINARYRGMDAPEVLQSIVKLPGAAVGARYIERTAALLGEGERLLDKHPGNFFSVPLIAQAFSQARIVAVIKSPMDSGFSNLKELFSGDAYAYSYEQREVAEHYAGMLELAQAFMHRYPQQFLAVSYNDLVNAPQATLQRVAQFCGLDYLASAADITRNASVVATASASQVRDGVHSGYVGNWARYAEALQPMRQRFIELGIDPEAVPSFLRVS